ncbi:MAG: efflux RND transporter periplasmic adaptor subunit [Bacteroidota bacterium]
MALKRTYIFSTSLLLLLVAAFIIVRYFYLRSSGTGEIETSVVTFGNVIDALPAEGVVEPESEVLLLSPSSSIIKRIDNEVGSHVDAGQSIIILDPAPIRETVDRLKDQLEMKENNLKKTRLNARSTRVDLDYNVEVKKLRIASLKSQLADEEQLLEVGGISPARMEQTRQELTLAEKDLDMIVEKNSIRLKQLEAEEEGLAMEIAIQNKELAAQEELLSRMVVRAPSSGIILNINGNVGEKVERDRLLVRMSDLSNFKITARIEEKYSEIIKTGRPVVVRIEDVDLQGKVGTVSPVISNKRVEFDVFLDQSSHWKLRPNLSVEVLVIREQADSVLCIKQGPAIARNQDQAVYVVDGNLARRTMVRTGMAGGGKVAILSGLKEGDVVITSDIAAYRNKEQFEIH